jgi:hypothetical protein
LPRGFSPPRSAPNQRVRPWLLAGVRADGVAARVGAEALEQAEVRIADGAEVEVGGPEPSAWLRRPTCSMMKAVNFSASSSVAALPAYGVLPDGLGFGFGAGSVGQVIETVVGGAAAGGGRSRHDAG